MIRSPLSAATRRLLPRQRLCPPALSTAFRYGSKMENGQRIYTSNYPSVMGELAQERTLYEFMMKRIKKADPNKVALIQAESQEAYTFQQVTAAIDKSAAVLYHNYHVRQGSCVCVAMLNHVVFAPAVYGTLQLGAVVSTINPMGDANTYAYHLAQNQASVIIGMRYFQKVLEAAVDLVQRDSHRDIAILYAEDLLTQSSPDLPADYDGLANATPEDTIFIPFSSGTTGLPKGVQLTNKNLIANVLQMSGTLRPGDTSMETDVGISVLPFFHIYGFTCCLNLMLESGGKQIVMTKFNLLTYVELIERYRVTVIRVAPPVILALLKNYDKFKHMDLTSLRVLNSGAAPLDVGTHIAASKMLPACAIGQGYGMTEMSPTVTAPPPYVDVITTPGANGYILPDTEVRIVKVDEDQQSGADKSRGEDCADGEEGEIWTRGPQLMKGYLKQEDTDKCMQDGWYRTGDIGRVDTASTELFITDRLKELIKYKGFQVSPAQLEGVVLQHPWVMDCIVIGVPDPREASFEVPRALVVLKPDLPTASAVRASDEIYRFVMARCPPQKRLHGGVRIVESIPKNAAGKLLRRQARQEELDYIKTADAETESIGI